MTRQALFCENCGKVAGVVDYDLEIILTDAETLDEGIFCEKCLKERSKLKKQPVSERG